MLVLAYAPDGRGFAGTATGLPAADRTVDLVVAEMYVDPGYLGRGCAGSRRWTRRRPRPVSDRPDDLWCCT